MKRATKVVVMVIAAVALFVFLAPVIPDHVNLCTSNSQCVLPVGYFPATVSVSYYAIGVGGRVVGTTYQVLFWPGEAVNV